MASTSKNNPPHQEQCDMIPVLTVLKNNQVLNNIFFFKDVMIFGISPLCDFLLTHPSLSPLQVGCSSYPSSRIFLLTDLYSENGTWKNGVKLEPGETVAMKEGDAFKVGFSSRVYVLSWVTREKACDLNNPFVYNLEQEVDQVLTKEQQQQLRNDKTRQHRSFLEQNSQQNSEQNVRKKNLLHHILEQNGMFGTTGTLNFGTKFGSGNNKPCERGNRVLSPPCVQSVDELDNTEKTESCPEAEIPVETNLFCTLREYLTQNICLPVVEAFQGSSLLTNIDSASFDVKGAAAAAADSVMPKECVEGISAAGARVLNSDENSSISRLLTYSLCKLPAGVVMRDSASISPESGESLL